MLMGEGKFMISISNFKIIYIYILYYMVESVTLGFMYSAIVRQSEDFQIKPINMVIFLFEKCELFVCMCA